MSMTMVHMKQKWRADPRGLGWTVETDVPRGGPFFYVARTYPALPGDDTGELTARMIAESHNREVEVVDVLEDMLVMMKDLLNGYPEKELHKRPNNVLSQADALVERMRKEM